MKRWTFLLAGAGLCNMALAGVPEPKFCAQTIDDKIQIGYGVTTADVDGDGKTDILLADKRQFIWYRNPTWEKFILAENLTKRDNVCIAAQDIDDDGKCEIAVGGDWDPNDRETSGAVFYLVAPEDRTRKWEPIKLHAEPTVHRMKWMRLGDKEWGLVVAPLHGRGDDPSGSMILLYRMPKNARDAWDRELITQSLHATHNLAVDGDVIVVASHEGVVHFARNPKTQEIIAVPPNSKHPAGEVRVGEDFVATVEPMHGNALVVYVDDQRQVLTEAMAEGHALAVSDVLQPGRDDVVVGWRGKGGGIRLFSPADANYKQWRETNIDDRGMTCEDLCLADLDGDKNLDIIASGRATKNVKIYWNETQSAPTTLP